MATSRTTKNPIKTDGPQATDRGRPPRSSAQADQLIRGHERRCAAAEQRRARHGQAQVGVGQRYVVKADDNRGAGERYEEKRESHDPERKPVRSGIRRRPFRVCRRRTHGPCRVVEKQRTS